MAIISIPTSISGVSIPGEAGRIASGPLSALYGGKGVTTISYPQELATDSTKNHYVQFSIKEIIPQSYDKVVGATQNIFNKVQDVTAAQVAQAAEDAKKAVENVVSNIVEGFQDLINDPLKVGGNVVGGVGGVGGNVLKSIGTAAGYADDVLRQLVKPKTTVSKAVISLYMPDTLESSYTANYSEISLAAEMKSIQSIRQIAQVASTFGQGLSEGGARQAFGAASSDPNVIAGAIGFGLGVLDKIPFISTGGNLGDVLLQGQGYASNPQLQMLYQGTNFRQFSLAFTFTPKSQAEAQIVNNIIYQFKYYAAPAIAQGKTNSSESMFLIPPAIFNVNFFFKDVDNKYLPKYADCVLKNIDINYAPNGFAAHIDGAPIQTHMTLHFEEIEIVDKARLSKGYFTPDDKEALR